MPNRVCPQCTDVFATNEIRRLFCSDACNTDFLRGNSDYCYYCGMPSESEDHIFPQTFGHGSGDRIPACIECNSILQHFAPTSIINRMKLLLERLQVKYLAHMNRGNHTDEEISEYGGSIQQQLEADRENRRVAESRIEFLRDRIDKTVEAQSDLKEVGTELEDFEVDVAKQGYEPKDVP
jgi:hypothetical protein